MELALATMTGIILAGSAMLLRDDMLGKRHAVETETRLRLEIAELERRQIVYEADFKVMLREISELKGLVLSLTKHLRE